METPRRHRRPGSRPSGPRSCPPRRPPPRRRSAGRPRPRSDPRDGPRARCASSPSSTSSPSWPTQARDWDELMRTLVDRTTEALHVEVCSFYLLDHATDRLTPGGDERPRPGPGRPGQPGPRRGRDRRGRRRPAADRRPRRAGRPALQVPPRLRPRGLTSMLSVPLPWNDLVVGVLNVQTVATRRFTPAEVNFLVTIAALLGRHRREGPPPARSRSASSRRSRRSTRPAPSSCAVVTHELRTPLSVVRAYVDLLADAAAGRGDAPARASSEDWRNAAIDQISRLDRLVDSILVSVRGDGLGALARAPFDVGGRSPRRSSVLRPLLRYHQLRLGSPETRARGARRRGSLPPGAGAAPGERGEVRAARLGRLGGRVAPGRRDPGLRHRRRAGRPRSRNGRRSSRPSSARPASAAAAPGSGCTRRAG